MSLKVTIEILITCCRVSLLEVIKHYCVPERETMMAVGILHMQHQELACCICEGGGTVLAHTIQGLPLQATSLTQTVSANGTGVHWGALYACLYVTYGSVTACHVDNHSVHRAQLNCMVP